MTSLIPRSASFPDTMYPDSAYPVEDLALLTLTPVTAVALSSLFCSESLACSESIACTDLTGWTVATAGTLTLTPGG